MRILTLNGTGMCKPPSNTMYGTPSVRTFFYWSNIPTTSSTLKEGWNMPGWKNIIRHNTKKWKSTSEKGAGTSVVPVGMPTMFLYHLRNQLSVTLCSDRNITGKNSVLKVPTFFYRTVSVSAGRYRPLPPIVDWSASHHKNWIGATNLSTVKTNIHLPSGYGKG